MDGERHAGKMQATIVALVNARLAQESEETVWEQPETCARNTYHAKWKKQTLFADVLGKVYEVAQDWHRQRLLYSIEDATEALVLATPDAVARLVDIMAQVSDLTNARLAATAILDRAGIETASKSSSRIETEVDVRSLSDAELQALIDGKQ